MSKATILNPKVFISYAWGTDENQQRVLHFGTELMNAGIDVLLDKWDLKEGNDKYAYMEKCVTDNSVTNVLILLDKTYQEKADSRQGGVGDETQIISPQIYGKVAQKKFIPIVFSRGDDGSIYKPAYLKSTLHVDLSLPDEYEANFQYLVKLLYGVEIYKKPTLGTKPAFVEDDTTVPMQVKLKFDGLKTAKNERVQKIELKNYLNELCEEIVSYKTDDIITGESYYSAYLERYKGTMKMRDKFLELVKASVYVNDSESQMADFFEQVYNRIAIISSRNKEILSILLHEMFIYTIAFYVKYEMFSCAGHLLERTYYNASYCDHEKSFSMFYCEYFHAIDDAMRERDGKNYISGEATLWIEDLNHDFCSKDEFVLADILCYNHYLFSPVTKISKDWFPITYHYGTKFEGKSVLSPICIKMKSNTFLQKILSLFGHENKESFVEQFKKIEIMYNQGELKGYRYHGVFGQAPLLCQGLASSEIGMNR